MSFVPLLARRLLALVPLLLAVSLLTFVLLDRAGGDYFSRLLADPQVSQEHVAELRRQFGLDRPLLARYGSWLLAALQGDLGHSLRYHLPVASLVAERAAATLLLTATSLLLAWGLGLALGLVAALRPRSLLDRLLGALAYAGLSLPPVLAALLALLFAASTGLFPVGGMQDELRWDELSLWGRVQDVAWHLVLPALVLSLAGASSIMRQMRALTLEALGQDHVVTARAKGLPERVVVLRHAARSALNPLLTQLGYGLGGLLTGSFLVEIVFAWPGLARLTYEALIGRDVQLVLAGVLLASLMLVLGNFLADLLLAALDPRLRVDR